MDIFYEIFNDLPRGGPGANEYTRKAYQMMEELPEEPKILDIGCGKGIQTLELARISGGHITGLDNHQPFLEEFLTKAKDIGLGNKIDIQLGSMFSMDFKPESFDVLWSEGAIYIIGFEAGLKEWRGLLKLGGYIAISELCWFKSDPPQEMIEFWEQEYPAIKSIDENLEIIESSGYQIIGHFNLPDNVWWESLYHPMGKKVNELMNKYKADQKSLEILKIQRREIDYFRKYSEWYGYTFFIMQKID